MARPKEIAKQVLVQLAEWDGPIDEAILHAAINARLSPAAEKKEFDQAMEFCLDHRLVTRVHNKLRGGRWSITDKGRAELDA